MEQFSSGKVMSLMDTIAVTCVSGQPRLVDWRALCPLISVFAHRLPARDFPRSNPSGYAEKDLFRLFFDSAPRSE